MAEQKNRWTWEVPGFEPRRSFELDDDQRPSSQPQPQQPILGRYSVSPSSIGLRSADLSRQQSLPVKLQKLKEQVKRTREDYLDLRQEANDLREYSNAKLERVTRYLGVLADRARKLDQAALETEARISPLVNEKKRLFNDLLTAKGNVKVYCRTRPLFEDEGPSMVEFPDDCTIRVNTGDDSVTNAKKDYEFDRVYGPHIGQGEFFCDVQPFVQSAMDGYNVSIFAYGQTHSGKTHTMLGSNHDRGLYQRSFEELFDLSNSDSTSTSQYNFYVTAFELHNEQVQDLLAESGSSTLRVRMGPADGVVELVQEKVGNPLDFSRVLKAALQNRGTESSRTIVSHLVLTIHIQYSNWVSRENLYSKLSLVDLAGSECLLVEDATGDHVKDFLHVSKSLSALGDVLYSLNSKKETIPYANSRLTRILSDSLGGSSKTLLIAHICPNVVNLAKTLSVLNFSARARNAELSLGNRDTIKKWRDIANDSRKELYDKEKEAHDLRQEVFELKRALNEANEQCTLLFNEVQKAWKVSFTLQADLKAENIMLSDKLKIEKEQNNQLRNQVEHLLQLEQDQKMQMHERDLTIQTLQAKIKGMESQLNEALRASDARSTVGSESGSSGVLSTLRQVNDSASSSAVTRKLEEELSKRDALIEKLHQENEKLFDRLTEKASLSRSPEVSSPSTKRLANPQAQDINRRDGSNGRSQNALPSPVIQDKAQSTGALVKSGNEKAKTPAGEYLTAALMEFDPDQFESFAAIADGANKLLMLVLAAVIKAGAAREHEILAEIRDAVFSFIRKMEPKRVMDTMLVSRVRILYIRSLLARSPELQSVKVSPVERFLEKANTGRSRSSSRGSSPGRSPVYHDSSSRTALVDENIHGFKVNIKQEKKSKFSSIVLKLRGIDQETWRQHVTGGRLREITEDAKAFAIGNKALAALFVHTPAGELQRQIRSWLAENFEFLSVTGGDAIGGTTGQLELLSTAIMDGWMAGLGAAQPPSTDALGQLLAEYTKRVYTSQLQHLKDIAGTLATEEAEDFAHVNKLRSALESVDVKRRKILQQMRSDTALLTKEEGGSPIRNPSTAAEDARLASLIALDGMLKQVQEIMRQTSVSSLTKAKKKVLLASLDELTERMPSLLDIDHPCAQRQIFDARRVVESTPEQDGNTNEESRALQSTPAPKPCTIHSPSTGAFIDLRPLQLTVEGTKSQSAANESYHVKGYDYPSNFTINFCGPVVEELRDVRGVRGVPKHKWANVSAFYNDSEGDVYSLGQESHELLFRGKRLLMNYTMGSPCPELDEDGMPIERRKIEDDDDEDEDEDEDDDEEDEPIRKPQKAAKNRRKSTMLSFVCDTSPLLATHPSVSFVGTMDHCTYWFEVRSRHVCGGTTTSDTKGTLGPAGVFGVILGIALLVYLVGGIVYQRNVMHQRGWRQLPNYAVWAGLFGFISDMFIILFSSCFQRAPSLQRLFGGRRGGYHRVGTDDVRSGRGRDREAENRLIDSYDEEWDN